MQKHYLSRDGDGQICMAGYVITSNSINQWDSEEFPGLSWIGPFFPFRHFDFSSTALFPRFGETGHFLSIYKLWKKAPDWTDL